MAKKEPQPRPLNLASTKKEMLDAYNELHEQLKQRREPELKPEQRVEEKKVAQDLEAADSLSTEGIAKEIGRLKSEIGGMLVQLSDHLEEEIDKYRKVCNAVLVKDKELREIYEIERTASSLTALLEAQQQKRAQFDSDIAEQQQELENDIETKRDEWEKEKLAHEAEIKERNAAEKKARERDLEEFKYQFEREQQLTRERFEHDKAQLERDMQQKREELERDLASREKAIADREAELQGLREKVQSFPKEMETAMARAIKDITERLSREAQNREELVKKTFEGERNVLNARIEALQQTVKEQTGRVAALSAQVEKSYGQVQDIALKAIEGHSGPKGFAYPQTNAPEPARRPAPVES